MDAEKEKELQKALQRAEAAEAELHALRNAARRPHRCMAIVRKGGAGGGAATGVRGGDGTRARGGRAGRGAVGETVTQSAHLGGKEAVIDAQRSRLNNRIKPTRKLTMVLGEASQGQGTRLMIWERRRWRVAARTLQHRG